MKKLICILLFFIFSLQPFLTTKANTIENDDLKAKRLIESIVLDEYKLESMKLEISKERIYDIKLNKLGYVYEFQDKLNSDIFGFAVIIENEMHESYLVELTFDEVSPYIYKDYRNIYYNIGTYYEVIDDILLDPINNVYLDYEFLIGTDNYNAIDKNLLLPTGPTSIQYSSEVITYYYQDSSEKITLKNYPHMSQDGMATFSSYDSRTNCATVAGLSLVVYFENYHPNSSPLDNVLKCQTCNYKDYKYYSNRRDNEGYDAAEWEKLLDIYDYLYDSMDTDDYNILFIPSPIPGTPHRKFIEGLEDFYNQYGYKLSITDIIGNSSDWVSSINKSFYNTNKWTEYTESIDANIPVVIQLGGLATPMYEYIGITDEESSSYTRPGPYGSIFYFKKKTYSYVTVPVGMHTVIGYGYMEERLYDINPYGYPINPPLVDAKYVIISTGNKKKYVNYKSVSISQAYSISIYPDVLN